MPNFSIVHKRYDTYSKTLLHLIDLAIILLTKHKFNLSDFPSVSMSKITTVIPSNISRNAHCHNIRLMLNHR